MSEGYILSLVLCGVIVIMLAMFFGYNKIYLNFKSKAIVLEKDVKDQKKSNENQDKEINKLNEKLSERLLKEVEMKKDLEKQKEKLEESLKWSQAFRSWSEKDKEQFSQENKKLENERNQLEFVLSWCGISQEEAGIDGNISVFEWEKNPEIKKKVEEITQKTYREWREAERDVDSLSYQLEKGYGVSKDNQHVGDKRQRKWAIKEIEDYWNYDKAGKNGKIKGKTIEQFLPDNWRDNFQKKEEKEIIEEKNRLKNLIDEFANSVK